jgi:hypothetical protein
MVWYPNYLNDRILAGYKAEVDLKVGYIIEISYSNHEIY